MQCATVTKSTITRLWHVWVHEFKDQSSNFIVPAPFLVVFHLIPDPKHNWQHFKLSAMAAEAVRFAFVGCGIIARHHLGALKQSSHATAVTAVVDVNRKRAEELLKLLPRPEEQSNTERCKVCN